MRMEEFKNEAFKAALDLGASSAEAYYVENEDFSVAVLDGEIDEYSLSGKMGFNLRVEYEGKNGYAYSEVLKDAKILAQKAIDNAKSIENEDAHPMQGKCEYVSIAKKEYKSDSLSEREKIDIALKLEEKTKNIDERVKRVQECALSNGLVKRHISNTLGLFAEEERKYTLAYVIPVAQNETDVRDGFAYRINDGVFDIDSLAKEAVEESTLLLDAQSVSAGKWDVIFKNKAMMDILSSFSSMFSADNVQKGLSLLNGKIGERIASDKINITDDPFNEYNPRSFDGEGTPSQKTVLVEKGELKGFLHNLKTAKKDNVESTANAIRSAKGTIGVGPSNLLIEAGEKSFDELVEKLNSGIIIKDVSGLHAGVNAVSGQFSLIASGQLVENGKITRSVDQITVGGNFIDFMKSIEEIGNDLEFSLPGGTSFASPSVIVRGLSISGK